MSAICPKCQCELREVGDCCPNDGWYGIHPDDLQRGDQLLGYPIGGKFVPLRRVGQGGMGIVYEGRQIGLGRTVAIKILSKVQQANDQVAQRFQREARSIARIVHPNVVQLIDSGLDADVAYIVMELIKGRELSSLKPNELSGQVIVHITHQILNALAEAHARNVIHRDLKPDNIMIIEDDDDKFFVKVLDFGLAALTDSTKITISGQALGTPWYMSPEQATASPVTTMTDIYSLGCILFELASGSPPFSGNRPFNVMMQHVNAEVPQIVLRPEVELSSNMIAFIYKCLQKDPNKRYLTAIEALDALHECPEWVAASQLDPIHSISLVMRQLSEMDNVHSEISKVVSADSVSSPSNSKLVRVSSLSKENSKVVREGSVSKEISKVTRESSVSKEISKVVRDSSVSKENSKVVRTESVVPESGSVSVRMNRVSVETASISMSSDVLHSASLVKDPSSPNLIDEHRPHTGSNIQTFEHLNGFAPTTNPAAVRANTSMQMQKSALQNRRFNIIMLVLGVILLGLIVAIVLVLTK